MISSRPAEDRNETIRRVIGKAQFIDRVTDRPDRTSLRADIRARYLSILKRTVVAGLLGSAATCAALVSIYQLAAPIGITATLLLAVSGFAVVAIIVVIYWYRPHSTSGLAGPGQRRKASGHVWHADYKFTIQLDQDILKRRKHSHDLAVDSLRTCLRGYPLCVVLRDFRTIAEISGSKQVAGGWQEYGTSWSLNTGNDESADARLAELLLPLCPVVSIASPVQTDLREGSSMRIAKLELPNEGWADVARDLIAVADWIVVLANRVTQGLSYELELVREQQKQDKTLVVIPAEESLDLEDIMTTGGYNLMNPPTEIEHEIPADFTARALVQDLEPEIAYSRLATARMLNTLYGKMRSVQAPPLIPDTEREQRLERLIAELTECESVQHASENRAQLWELLMSSAAVSNELRHYVQAAVLAQRALKLVQGPAVGNRSVLIAALLARDGLLSALINMNNCPTARNELVHQLDDLEVVLGMEQEEGEMNQFVRRTRLHLGRIGRESTEPVDDLEARLVTFEN